LALRIVAHGAPRRAILGGEDRMTRLYARTSAEAQLYMDLRPCACGELEFDRQSSVVTIDEALCSRYAGPCRGCGAPREFVFELPAAVRPVRGDGVDFGGSDPSRLLDPGEWLAVADEYAALDPPGEFDVAAGSVDEVLKFIPAGGDAVPGDAFHSERGRAIRDRDPDRFQRARLEALRDDYAAQLAQRLAARAAADAEPAQPRLDEAAPDQLTAALAASVVRGLGLDGDERQRQIESLEDQLRTVVHKFQTKIEDDRRRRQTMAEFEQLLERARNAGTPSPDTLAAQREAMASAFRGLDLPKLSDGLHTLVAWLRNPSDETRAPISQMVSKLQTAMGTVINRAAEAEAAAKAAAEPGPKLTSVPEAPAESASDAADDAAAADPAPPPAEAAGSAPPPAAPAAPAAPAVPAAPSGPRPLDQLFGGSGRTPSTD
jgi:hypothetical protein